MQDALKLPSLTASLLCTLARKSSLAAPAGAGADAPAGGEADLLLRQAAALEAASKQPEALHSPQLWRQVQGGLLCTLARAAAAAAAGDRGGAGEGQQQGEEQEAAARLLVARAGAQRRCAHLGCTTLLGRSEAAMPALRCQGCMLARYCSMGCQRAAWGRHKLVCRRLREGSG